MLAPIRPGPTIPSCFGECVLMRKSSMVVSWSASLGLLENADELPVATANFRHSGFPRCLPGQKVQERLQEIRPAHCEPDETFDPSRRRQPLAHFFVVFATAKNDAADFVPSIAAPIRGGVAQNRAAKLFVHENARLELRHAGSDGGFDPVVDLLFGRGDFGGLLPGQCAVQPNIFVTNEPRWSKGRI